MISDPEPSEASRRGLDTLRDRIVRCRRCPRLVEWRRRIAREKRAAYEDEEYWGRPVPGHGDPHAWLLVVGLAPGAHGANRTGRFFTGGRSGRWLVRALHRAGLANRPDSRHRRDGLELRGTWIGSVVRCVPPENRPTPEERAACREYLEEEVRLLLPTLRVVVPLGGYAYAHALRIFRDRNWEVPSPMPDFAHGLELTLAPPASASHRPLTLLASYHPSQQNTFTGTLTEEMFDGIWARAREVGGIEEEEDPGEMEVAEEGAGG